MPMLNRGKAFLYWTHKLTSSVCCQSKYSSMNAKVQNRGKSESEAESTSKEDSRSSEMELESDGESEGNRESKRPLSWLYLSEEID